MTSRSFHTLENSIIKCDRCPRLRKHCLQIAREKKRAYRDQEYWGKPVPGFGDPQARLLVVGLAPAAHGANRTGRMFTGDSSGDWLYEALYRSGFANQPHSTGPGDGLHLSDCYITAAARCAPPGNKPTAHEIGNCRPFLQEELKLLSNVEVVLTLGRIAHDSWLKASGLERPPFGHGAEATVDGKILISCYHPSRQNTNTGRLTREMWYRVFRRCRTLIDNV